MIRAKLTTRGQLTIPKPVRERLGVQAGDELEFREEGGAAFLVQKAASGSPFAPWRGHLTHLASVDPDDLVEDTRGR